MYHSASLRTVTIVRYAQPLREGGSLPGLVEADDGERYVVKFRGNGHGPKALIAELIGGEVVRALGLPVPELVYAELGPEIGRSEGDEEIQDLLRASVGSNAAMRFLPGAITYDPAAHFVVEAALASRIVWADAYLTNIDRTAKNTNMLRWQGGLQLIDHGSCLYFQHAWENRMAHAVGPFSLVKDHVLLPFATQVDQVAHSAMELLSDEVLQGIVDLLPDSWLQWPESDAAPAALRADYLEFLRVRRDHAAVFTAEAVRAHHACV